MGGMRGWLGIGGGVTSPPSQNSPYGGHMSQNLHWNAQFLRFYKNNSIIAVLDIERAGSRTLEKFSRSRRDRDCAKFESSRRFRDSNMNPKKKSRRYRVSVSIHALDLAISRFTHSFASVTQSVCVLSNILSFSSGATESKKTFSNKFLNRNTAGAPHSFLCPMFCHL